MKRALEIDQETGTHFWRDAIRKEMKAIKDIFKHLEDGQKPPPGYNELTCHIIFDIKPDFTRKARYVADGHKLETPSTLTYASVVSRESVRIFFTLAALNGLEVKAADISNAYLNAPCAEKLWIRCGPEFGPEHNGEIAILLKALYGLKSAGASWRRHCAQMLHDELHFLPSRGDNDVWFKPAVKEDGTKYYEYVLVYTDDLLVGSMDTNKIMTSVDQHFHLKKGSVK